MKHYRFSKSSKRRRQGVHPALVEISDLALEISPIDFGIPEHGGVRTAEQQRKLYDRGLSNADGTTYISKHQYGDALDFYAWVDGAASWDEHHLAVVGAAFLQAANRLGYDLEWGGLWHNFKDYPHVELTN